MKSERLHCSHEFPPYFNGDSKVLVLGSFPSAKSRAEAFYYAHPQNRFWRVLGGAYNEPAPVNLNEKKDFLKRHFIALWDVIECCDVLCSSDLSIKNAVPTNIVCLIKKCPVERIILNGKAAERYFFKFQKEIKLPVFSLPSTSPANAAWKLESLIETWKCALISKQASAKDCSQPM